MSTVRPASEAGRLPATVSQRPSRADSRAAIVIPPALAWTVRLPGWALGVRVPGEAAINPAPPEDARPTAGSASNPAPTHASAAHSPRSQPPGRTGGRASRSRAADVSWRQPAATEGWDTSSIMGLESPTGGADGLAPGVALRPCRADSPLRADGSQVGPPPVLRGRRTVRRLCGSAVYGLRPREVAHRRVGGPPAGKRSAGRGVADGRASRLRPGRGPTAGEGDRGPAVPPARRPPGRSRPARPPPARRCR